MKAVNSMNTTTICMACRKGKLRAATETRTFHPNGKTVEVKLHTSRCSHCGESTTLAAQHDENLKRLAARKAHYEGLLLGEEYLRLRKTYGLTQRMASKIFGKGVIAFSRYENEESYPDKTTSLLIELAIEQPDVLKRLADKAGIDIPLWNERQADANPQSHKRVVMPSVTIRVAKSRGSAEAGTLRTRKSVAP